jgi:hypothetical protein
MKKHKDEIAMFCIVLAWAVAFVWGLLNLLKTL